MKNFEQHFRSRIQYCRSCSLAAFFLSVGNRNFRREKNQRKRVMKIDEKGGTVDDACSLPFFLLKYEFI